MSRYRHAFFFVSLASSSLGLQRVLLLSAQRLLRNTREFGLDWLVSGSRGKFGLLLKVGRSHGRGAGAATEHVLNLAGVVTSILLAEGGNLRGLLLDDVSNLGSLSVDNIGDILKLLVDQLLVGNVDQGSNESDDGANNSEAPVGNKLGQMEGDKCTNGSLCRKVISFGS
jgi:hypothetical protein